MKRKMAVVMLVVMLVLALMSLAAVANAATAHPCAPVAKAFTKAAGYMSLAGDLRQRMYAHTGVWMTPRDAKDCYVLKDMFLVNGWQPTDPGPGMVALEELKPFSSQTNHMSIAGYLRWLEKTSTS